MSTIATLQLNRRGIDALKRHGRNWLVENIAMEKRLTTKDDPKYVLYIQAMERALKELDQSTTNL
jgi:hypothetical protein